MEADAKKVIVGNVVRYADETMGTFRNVFLSGCEHKVTIGIGDGLTYPRRGQRISVTGVVRHGRFLTQTWDYV